MKNYEELKQQLHRLDARPYKAYKAIAGTYQADAFVLWIDHVQGDPFAEPSRVRVVVPAQTAQLPSWSYQTRERRRATADFLNRRFATALTAMRLCSGTGHSGKTRILKPGQKVLARTSLHVHDHAKVEARFRIGLPAQGRRILGHQAANLLTRELPRAVARGLLFSSIDAQELARHVETVEDAVALRKQLSARGLAAFVANGACLPRRSGVDDRPMSASTVKPFFSPSGLEVTLEAPNAGSVTGMGIPSGVTLIVGGGYHGKSTLLKAIEVGVYDHIPGDGREQVVTSLGAVKIRAEDGRRVAGTDISNFISGLPDHGNTAEFFTDNASGSTSQAAAICEALEMNATTLLLDEDTSATNFMVRDARMQQLVGTEFEPITPFIDRVRSLADEHHVSTILVMGGCGDYFDVADHVIAMRGYEPYDVTHEAKAIANALPCARRDEALLWHALGSRVPDPESVDPSRGRKAVSVKTFTEERVAFGSEEVDLAGVEQIVELAQTRAMAQALVWARGRIIDGERALPVAIATIMARLDEEGLELLTQPPQGDFAEFRGFELAAFLNRLRSLRVG